jgi:hypothetical protein
MFLVVCPLGVTLARLVVNMGPGVAIAVDGGEGLNKMGTRLAPSKPRNFRTG